VPLSFKLFMSATTSLFDLGSRFDVGSSSTRIFGRMERAVARAALFFCPKLKDLGERCARSAMPVACSAQRASFSTTCSSSPRFLGPKATSSHRLGMIS